MKTLTIRRLALRRAGAAPDALASLAPCPARRRFASLGGRARLGALLVLATAGLTAPALAGKPRASSSRKKAATVEKVEKPRKAPVIDYGESYGLTRNRKTALPVEAAPVVELAGLSQAQVGVVVKDRLADLDYCWSRMLTGERVPGTAVLKLSIEMTGEVAGIDVGGDVPDGACSCIETAARRWTFPAAAIASEVEYPVTLK
jgi:hypothetical protein